MNHGPIIASRFTNACETGDIDEVKKALATVNSSELAKDGEALQGACKNGHFEVVKTLLLNPDFVKTASSYCNYAFRLAVEHGHFDIVVYMYNTPHVFDENLVDLGVSEGGGEVEMAAQGDHLHILNYLLEQPIFNLSAAANNNAALRAAARCNHARIVERLLQINCVKNEAAIFSNSALKYAIRNGNLEIVKLLLDIESVVNCDGKWYVLDVITDVVEYERYDIASILLKVPQIQKYLKENPEIERFHRLFFSELKERMPDISREQAIPQKAILYKHGRDTAMHNEQQLKDVAELQQTIASFKIK